MQARPLHVPYIGLTPRDIILGPFSLGNPAKTRAIRWHALESSNLHLLRARSLPRHRGKRIRLLNEPYQQVL